MKSLVAIVTLVLASQSLAAPASNGFSDLIVDTILYLEKLFTSSTSVKLPDITDTTYQAMGVDLSITMTGNTVSVPKLLDLHQISTDPVTNSATVQLDIPQIIFSGSYKIDGAVSGTGVKGSGSYKISMTSVTPSLAVTFVDPSKSVVFKSMTACYFVDSIENTIDGLTIDGFDAAAITNLIQKTLPDYIKNHCDIVSGRILPFVQSDLNLRFQDVTFDDAIAWLRSH